jgi:hypothetical protein
MSNLTNTKATYTKPTLTEYGSLAERTKIFGLPDGPDPDLLIGQVLTVSTPSNVHVAL